MQPYCNCCRSHADLSCSAAVTLHNAPTCHMHGAALAWVAYVT